MVFGWKQGGDSVLRSAQLPAERVKACAEADAWLKEQFALIKAGKKPAMKEPAPYRPSRWTIDAP